MRGMATLAVVSAVAALGLAIVPHQWVSLLGLVPFGLGPRGLIKAIRDRGEGEQPPVVMAAGLRSVAGVTLANGADNISAYTPMFRTIGVGASTGPLVHHQDRTVLRGHDHQAPPRHHRRKISPPSPTTRVSQFRGEWLSGLSRKRCFRRSC
jgi:hypothetical protein